MEGWEALDTSCKFAEHFNICKDYETATPAGCHCYATVLGGMCAACPPDHPQEVQTCTFSFTDAAQVKKSVPVTRLLCAGVDITAQSVAPFECTVP